MRRATERHTAPGLWAEIDGLRQLKTGALRATYRQVCGAETRSSNKQFLLRRIAWRLQANAEGDLSERARRRAAEIADDADLRLRAPRRFAPDRLTGSLPAQLEKSRQDWRLPSIGTILTRQYRGQPVLVHVCADGFEYQGRAYRSLSAIAREVTGTRWNGFAFFHLQSGAMADREGENEQRGRVSVPAVRCAIYTRKSTEEGLEQAFNSLVSCPSGS